MGLNERLTLRIDGISDDIEPVNTILLPCCHRRFASIAGRLLSEDETCPKLTTLIVSSVSADLCSTVTGFTPSEKWKVMREKGIDEIVMELGAVNVNWNAASSPTLTS